MVPLRITFFFSLSPEILKSFRFIGLKPKKGKKRKKRKKEQKLKAFFSLKYMWYLLMLIVLFVVFNMKRKLFFYILQKLGFFLSRIKSGNSQFSCKNSIRFSVRIYIYMYIIYNAMKYKNDYFESVCV